MAGATDNLDTRILFGRLSADSPVLTSWPKLWVGVLIGGIITGPCCPKTQPTDI